jgi:hypothetical protein
VSVYRKAGKFSDRDALPSVETGVADTFLTVLTAVKNPVSDGVAAAAIPGNGLRQGPLRAGPVEAEQLLAVHRRLLSLCELFTIDKQGTVTDFSKISGDSM